MYHHTSGDAITLSKTANLSTYFFQLQKKKLQIEHSQIVRDMLDVNATKLHLQRGGGARPVNATYLR
jgi:hypothetical protein